MELFNRDLYLNTMLYQEPAAYANIFGSPAYDSVYGWIMFYLVPGGTLVQTQITGLPIESGLCGNRIHGFHIHSGSVCNGTGETPFSAAGGHYNPGNCPHPEHAGDMPPLFSNHGFAWSSFYTDLFLPKDVVGKTVIVHARQDDFTTQPSGNSGEMIACGEIKKYN